MPNAQSWYDIKPVNAAKGAADVYLYGFIGDDDVPATAFIDALLPVKAPAINLHINSRGGRVDDGIAIYNALKDHPARVNVTVDALAASIASVIAQAGDKRRMAAGSMMFIHEPMSGVAAQVLGNAADMRELAGQAQKQAEYLDKIGETVAEIYAARAGSDAAEWRGFMQAETWYRAQEAVDAGLADEVVPSKSATNLLVAFNVADLGCKNVPEWVQMALDPAPIVPPTAENAPVAPEKWPFLAHHAASGAVDGARMRLALARAYNLNIPVTQRDEAIRHLEAHARLEGARVPA